MIDKPRVLSNYALLYWIIWAATLIVLRITLLFGINDDAFPAIFLISLVAYLPGLVFIAIDTSRYFSYMKTNHRDFIDDKWNDWNHGGSVRFVFSERDLGDPNLAHFKRPARIGVLIVIFCFLPIFAGTYYLFFKVIR